MSKRGIPREYILDYEQYRQDLDPVNILNELARCRVLLDQFSDSLAANKEDMRDSFLKVASENLESQLDVEGIDDEYKDIILKMANESYSRVYEVIFQPLSRMNYREAEAMAKILKTTSEIAEKYHHIHDGVTIKIDYNEKLTQAMMQFLLKIVMPNIPVQLRANVAFKARQFFPSLNGEVVEMGS